MDGRRPAAAVSPPCAGAAAVSAVDSSRPASTRPHPTAPGRIPSRTADPAAVSGSADTCWVPRQVGAAGGQRRSGRSTVDAAGGHRQPQAPGAADTRDGEACRIGADAFALADRQQVTINIQDVRRLRLDLDRCRYQAGHLPLRRTAGRLQRVRARLSDTSGEGIITNDIATGQAVVTIAPPTKRSKRPGCRTGRRSVDTRRVSPPPSTRRTDGCSGGWPSIYD
jgi:hypothetical protein